MMAMKEVPPEMFYRRCKPDDLKFETKAELKTGVEIPGSGESGGSRAIWHWYRA
jgi:hypothetical protein